MKKLLFLLVTVLVSCMSGAQNTQVTLSSGVAEASAPVYGYMFAFDNPQNPLMMSPHTAEIAYVFNNLGRNPMSGGQVTDEAQRVADAMSDAWISFARTGNPSTSALQWPAFTNANRATMLFAKENGVRIGFDDDLMRQLVPDYDFMK